MTGPPREDRGDMGRMHEDHRKGRSGSRGRIGGNLLRIAFGLLLGFVLAETGSRIYLALPSDPRTANFISDTEADYRIRPDRPEEILDPEDHFTALGVRGREHSREKPEGTFRVLGIGDSFVFGSVPMRDNFLRVAEREANSQTGAWAADGHSNGQETGGGAVAIEVIPLGVPGYNPENYLGILRSVGLGLDPDLVLMFFFVGNDVTGMPVRGRVYRGELYYVGSASPWLDLLRRSRFFMLAETVALRTLKRMHDTGAEVSAGSPPDEETRAPTPIGSRHDRDRIGAGPLDPDPAIGTTRPLETSPAPDNGAGAPSLPYLMFQARRLPIYAADPDRRIRGLWKEAETCLLDFDRACRAAGVPWTLVMVPAEVQIDERIRGEVLAALSRSRSGYDFDAPQKHLTQFCRDQGIDTLDLLPLLRSVHSEADRLYLPNNTHWSVRGNRIVGRRIAELVEEQIRSDRGVHP